MLSYSEFTCFSVLQYLQGSCWWTEVSVLPHCLHAQHCNTTRNQHDWECFPLHIQRWISYKLHHKITHTVQWYINTVIQNIFFIKCIQGMNFLHLLSASHEGAKAAIPASTHLSVLMRLIVENEKNSKLVKMFQNTILQKEFSKVFFICFYKRYSTFSKGANMFYLGIFRY